MDDFELMRSRHSVRSYTDQAIPDTIRDALRHEVEADNRASGLHMQLFFDEPKSFGSNIARYGRFINVKNYLAMVGPDTDDLQGLCGYYGEKVVLLAQSLGLNSCWVAMNYSRRLSACEIAPGEKLCLEVALGYGTTAGVPHKSKEASKVSNLNAHSPEWFKRGVEAALLAPTAINQQRFYFLLTTDGKVKAGAKMAYMSRLDLGIARYHFELGAGRDSFQWA